MFWLPAVCFVCRRFCFWLQAVFFLVVGGVLSATGELLPDTQRTNSASRAQNRGFCAFLAFRTLVFGLFEHKIGVFVLEQKDKWHREA